MIVGRDFGGKIEKFGGGAANTIDEHLTFDVRLCCVWGVKFKFCLSKFYTSNEEIRDFLFSSLK